MSSHAHDSLGRAVGPLLLVGDHVTQDLSQSSDVRTQGSAHYFNGCVTRVSHLNFFPALSPSLNNSLPLAFIMAAQ